MKNLSLLFTLAILSLVLMSADCNNKFPKLEPGDSRHMLLKNNSDKRIRYYFADGLNDRSSYPDTLLPVKTGYHYHEIIPGETYYDQSTFGWLRYVHNSPSDTLSLFIFNADTAAKYPWATIRKDYKVLKRYDFSETDLNLLNWTISYPPTESMKKIKMFPAYP